MGHQTFQDSLLNYFGLPYEKYDCWEFVRLVYRELLGIDIPQDMYDSPRLMTKKEICQNKSKYLKIIEEQKEIFVEVSAPMECDILLMNSHGLPTHVAIYAGNNSIIHSQRGIGVHFENYEKIKNKIIGIYRYDKI